MEQVSSYMDQQGERLALSGSILGKLKVVVDEIYSNIVRYSGATRAELDCSVYGSRLKLRFRDNGKPYNPLNASIPDVKASAEEREIGGLGIYMVRKLMDTMDYEYTYGMNRVTMTLVIPAEVQSKTREGEK
jgi:sigma-B regulation protein RsbU (phosphoserine phosphatase)